MKLTTKYASIDGTTPVAAAPRSVVLHAADAADAVELAPHAAAHSSTAAQTIPHPQGWHAPAADNDAQPDGRLSRAGFLRMVQREKRRTDRSHSALSLAVVDLRADGERALEQMLERLEAMVRETDYLAAIDEHCIAVLLPDTGEAGLRSFVDKVTLERNCQASGLVGATYPKAEFDRLVAERLGTPRSRQLVDEPKPLVAAARGYFLKRALDVIASILALIVLSPLMLIVALAIKLSSRGPVIFRQERIGQGGVSFTFFKFRSMRCDNDDSVHRDYVASLIDGKARAAGAAGEFKMKADPRVTPIGRFIRKTSIDEIPQFYNVLKGDMSLVGPRPPVAYEAERYKAWHRRRVFDLKPGLTGIWQVEGRSRVSFDDMVRMDLRYLRECSLGCDLRILMKTIAVVLRCEGAQ